MTVVVTKTFSKGFEGDVEVTEISASDDDAGAAARAVKAAVKILKEKK